MAELVRMEDAEDWAARTPAEQTALRRLDQVMQRITVLLPLVEASRKRLATAPDRGPRAQRRQRETVKSQLRDYGEELQSLTTEVQALYGEFKQLLGPASQQYVEQVISRLVATAAAARQGS